MSAALPASCSRAHYLFNLGFLKPFWTKKQSRGVKKLSRPFDTSKNEISNICQPGISAEVSCISTSPMFPQSSSPERMQTPNSRKLTGAAFYSGHQQ
jgi:hypothetical protein